MELLNETKNQHFVPQVEQRLNAINPNAPKESQRIYSFTIDNREEFSIKLDSEKGRSIASTLSLNDLFSFDVIDKNVRYNFENLFNQYENSVETNTRSLLDKLFGQTFPTGNVDVKSEIIDIFASKLLNCFRNPYSVSKVLNTIGELTKYYPLDPKYKTYHYKIINGSKPQQKWLNHTLGISDVMYMDWLTALFIMLMRPNEAANSLNIFENMIKRIFEDNSNFIMVLVANYTGEHANKRCLLSDRGHCIPLPEDDSRISYAFNLCSHAFIIYIFQNIDKFNANFITHSVVEQYKDFQNKEKVVQCTPHLNNLSLLSNYNQKVVYYSHKNVYSSTKQVYGL